MKWINGSDQPPPKGAIMRDINTKQVIKNYSIKGDRIIEYDECSEEIQRFTFNYVEWLDETPSLDSTIKSGAFLKCECGVESPLTQNDLDINYDYDSMDNSWVDSIDVRCRCGKEIRL